MPEYTTTFTANDEREACGWTRDNTAVPQVFQHSRLGASVHRERELVSSDSPAPGVVVLPVRAADGRVNLFVRVDNRPFGGPETNGSERRKEITGAG